MKLEHLKEESMFININLKKLMKKRLRFKDSKKSSMINRSENKSYKLPRIKSKKNSIKTERITLKKSISLKLLIEMSLTSY